MRPVRAQLFNQVNEARNDLNAQVSLDNGNTMINNNYNSQGRINGSTTSIPRDILASSLTFARGAVADFTGVTMRGLSFDQLQGTIKQDVNTSFIKMRPKPIDQSPGVVDFTNAVVMLDGARVSGLQITPSDLPNKIDKPLQFSDISFAPSSTMNFQGLRLANLALSQSTLPSSIDKPMKFKNVSFLPGSVIDFSNSSIIGLTVPPSQASNNMEPISGFVDSNSDSCILFTFAIETKKVYLLEGTVGCVTGSSLSLCERVSVALYRDDDSGPIQICRSTKSDQLSFEPIGVDRVGLIATTTTTTTPPTCTTTWTYHIFQNVQVLSLRKN